MRQRVTAGGFIDAVTPDELVKILPRPAQHTRVRAVQQVLLDANGNGVDEVYKVPTGYAFEARRVTVNITGATGPNDGNIALNVAGKFVAYLRSGSLIEYANPASAVGVASIPGMQSWSREQGPYLRNGEVFEVQGKGLTANAILTCSLEGILFRPSTEPDDPEGHS